jgi:ribonucleoside-diphosphate reductase alpha chain
MAMAPEQTGIGIRRHFTTEGIDPYDETAWERRDARISNYRDGVVAFEQLGVEFPTGWSQNAANIVAQKYFRGPLGSPERERSLRQVVDRVVDTVTAWGAKDGYFVDDTEAEAFRAELKHLVVHQKAAFNSPVWFNIGVKGEPQQASACQPYSALVSTPEGLVPIGRLVEEGAIGRKVFDASGITRIVAVKANGRKPVLRIGTKSGHSLEVTADHLVWRASGLETGRFVPAGQLRPGDRVTWHRHTSWGDGEISRTAVAEAALAGWLQGDGFVGQYTGTNRSITIEAMTVTDAERAWVVDAIDTVFPAVHRHERPVPTQDPQLDCRRTRLYGEPLRDFVDRWDLRVRGTGMTVPASLFSAPLPVVAAYLRSLFQAEGYVSLKERSSVVGLAMISEGLVRGIQSLLLRFGIFSRIRFAADRRPDRKGCWALAIRTPGDRRRFADGIGFVDPGKAAKLEASFDLPGRATHDSKQLEIASIDEIGALDVYDIQTESGEYLSGGLRVHNCFILAVDDTMRSILNWYVEEGTIFKGGSGSGINLSNIRSSHEHLKGGGTASGPVSFMRGADASAGTIKCLHGDTPVVTDRGVLAIRETRAGDQVLTRFGYRPVEAVHDNGSRPLVRVRTAFGDEIVCTPEHKFRVRGRDGEGWSEAGSLATGDHVLIHVGGGGGGGGGDQLQPLIPVSRGYHTEIPHQLPAFLDEAMAMWLGWVYGDGSITTRPGAKFVAVQIGDDDPQLVDRYRALTRGVFGSHVHLFVDRHADKPDASASVRFASAEIIRFLEANGLRKEACADLRVPELIKASPPAVRAAFLAGLFEADGHIANGYAWLSTISSALARDVHRLLLSIGVPSTIGRIDDRRAAHGALPVHTVRVIGGEGMRRYAKHVGFVSDRKQLRLEAAVARKDASTQETQWFLPHVDSELRQVWAATTNQSLRRALAPYCRYARPRHMSLLRARALLDRFPDELGATTLARFAYGDELYAAVTVQPAGEGPTFDLTVEGVHEYLVNSVVTHNSGGKTRRAAKMVILNADHPDIEDFIWCKAVEERKARVLRDAGFDMDLDGKDSHSTQYQNANNSVRVTDEFMQAVVDDGDWALRAVTSGEPLRVVKARQLFRQIAEATWECADPGMQFDTTINRWHTASNTGPIRASNPCSEYMHLDNSACNLASLNLLKFLADDGTFDVEGFKAAVEVVFTAQEILVGNADYPTEKIGDNARRFRQLGLGYANLGAMLMALGIAYDSDAGRTWAAAITSLMTGHAYATSARTAARMGPFAGYTENREPMNRVLRMHRDEAARIDDRLATRDLVSAAQHAWDRAVEWADDWGVRNAQATVLAPTGCLVGGSLVATDRGLVRLRSLGDPGGAQWQDVAVRVATDEGARAATRFYVNGVEPVVTVDTARGYRIQGTTLHRVKVVDEATGAWGWKRFADIAPGDLVPLALHQLVGQPQTVPLPPLPDAHWGGEHHLGAPRSVTPELAELVGYFMGDGSMHAPGLRFCVADPDFDVVERLEQLGKEVFGVGATVTPRQGYQEVAFPSARLALWWEACGFARQSPREGHAGKGGAHIPDAILHSNDAAVYRAFLRGLFEAGGTVTAGVPSVSSTTPALASDVQGLLLALGYPTTRELDTTRTGWRQAPMAVVRVLDPAYASRWGAEIGFLGDRKNAAIAAVAAGDASQGGRHDHVPVTRAMVDRLAPANDRLRKVLLMELSRGRVPRRIATELFERTADAELGHVLSFFYDRVTSAELGDEQPTFDLSVPQNVTYVANGFVSHNTIGLMMDCDTTGIEPDLGLCKTKKLVGGGTMSIVNQTVPRALRRLGYSPPQVDDIVAYIDEHKSILGAPHISSDHLGVFACSMGDNVIHYLGHVRMMAAVQPWISGAISKTINMPEQATVEEMEQLHIDAWRMGLKAVAVYRDNCKVAQPLSTTKKDVAPIVQPVLVKQPVRERLPRMRSSKTFSFRVADCHGYVTVGQYDDGRPGEIFLRVAKQGSTLAGIMDAFAISVSHGLQYGVPLRAFVDMYTNMRFEPAGITDDAEIRFASSLVDYIFRRLAVEYLSAEERAELGILTVDERMQPTLPGVEELTTPTSTGSEVVPDPASRSAPAAQLANSPTAADAPYCYVCGVVMQRAGACFVCGGCGTTSGCS